MLTAGWCTRGAASCATSSIQTMSWWRTTRQRCQQACVRSMCRRALSSKCVWLDVARSNRRISCFLLSSSARGIFEHEQRPPTTPAAAQRRPLAGRRHHGRRRGPARSSTTHSAAIRCFAAPRVADTRVAWATDSVRARRATARTMGCLDLVRCGPRSLRTAVGRICTRLVHAQRVASAGHTLRDADTCRRNFLHWRSAVRSAFAIRRTVRHSSRYSACD